MAAALEIVLVVVVALIAWLRPAALAGWQRWPHRALRARWSSGAWAAALAAVTFAAQVAVAALAGLPQPQLHDEFSYLLAADTFARGRLANPTHPLWQHFETFHVLVQPTYASRYPPGQGLVLAVGQTLGHPILGVWLAGAAFAAAAAWMLRQWLRPPWARLGSLLIVATVLATTWDQGYRGGFVAATGGALLFGAAAALRRSPSAMAGTLLGGGLVVLALSRPWEGLVAAAAALAPLGWTALRDRGARRALARRALPALLVVLAAGGCWLAWYDWRVTGSPWKLPYVLYNERYARVPPFLWQRQPAAVAATVHPDMERFFSGYEAAEWRRVHTLPGMLGNAAGKLGRLWRFYLGVPGTLALLGLPWALRRPGPARRAAVPLLALLASQLVVLPGLPHYVAAGTCLVAVLVVEGLRQLRLWRRRSGRGRALAAAVSLLTLLLVPVRALELRERDPWPAQRSALAGRLAALPGKQLVVVRYGAGHDYLVEWVYTDADLAGTRVLWARSMGPTADCALIGGERERTPWLLDVREDVTPPRLRPYPRSACAGSIAVPAATSR